MPLPNSSRRCALCVHDATTADYEELCATCLADLVNKPNFEARTAAEKPTEEELLRKGYAAGAQPEYTGGSVSYYKVHVASPTSGGVAYDTECNDIIEALGMNYAEGNAFKAIWRSCAARNLKLAKQGYKDGVYDAEKVVFFGERMVAQAKKLAAE